MVKIGAELEEYLKPIVKACTNKDGHWAINPKTWKKQLDLSLNQVAEMACKENFPKTKMVGTLSSIQIRTNMAFLFEGKDFLVKELTVNSKSSISLQKHYHRSEHWMITQGKPKITLNNNKFFKNKNETIFIPSGSIHRIENYYNKPVKIIEVQLGSILKESDIVRYQDIYGRIK